MARGWESKSVEDQIASYDAAAARRLKPGVTPADAAREARRQTLQLARSRAQQDLQLACDGRHRAMLETLIADLDARLSRL